ncbi:hypothetical protein SteCoe_21529 [Stentor coeruleus]|uniref:Uncharacterized protein n=1 Tax=Stentor coeruleus TaxID=5963 RepID=A0A1R2BPT5_9CILI|nr:hypothetical protein SteCoe_21529 [Stentor coeruleus]
MKQERQISPKFSSQKKNISHIKTSSVHLSLPSSKDKSADLPTKVALSPMSYNKCFYFPSQDSQPNSPSKIIPITSTQGVIRSFSLSLASIHKNTGDIITVPDIESLSPKGSQIKQESPTPIVSVSKTYKRQDSRSNTELNTRNHIATSKKNDKQIESKLKKYTRKESRRNTEIIKPHELNSRFNNPNPNTTSIQKTSVYNTNSTKLSKNYKNEQISSRVLQKEKPLYEDFSIEKEVIFECLDYNHYKPDHDILPPSRPELKSQNRSLLSPYNNKRLTIPNNANMFPEQNIELLHSLTQSVKELNERLIKSEEITYERLKENKLLKGTIESLERQFINTEYHKIEDSGIKPGCHKGCWLF